MTNGQTKHTQEGTDRVSPVSDQRLGSNVLTASTQSVAAALASKPWNELAEVVSATHRRVQDDWREGGPDRDWGRGEDERGVMEDEDETPRPGEPSDLKHGHSHHRLLF